MAALEPVVPHSSLGLELDSLPSDSEAPDFLAMDVPLDTSAANMIEATIATSLPGFRLVSLRRFANKRLWQLYVARRDDIAKTNNSNPNVKLLFHGTMDPQRIIGTGLQTNSEGFDFRRSAEGKALYGVGSYFASHAAYPVKIHPRHSNPDGTYTLILAEVACGAVQDMEDATDKALRLPKERSNGLLYDCVRGTENSVGPRHWLDLMHGEQYVVYNHDQAYPHFVVVIQYCPPLAAAPVDGTYVIRNAESGRKLFALKDQEWTEGVGAGREGEETHPDNKWNIMAQPDGTHVIRNAESGRKLFALKDHEWTEGVGAGREGEETHPDNKWNIMAQPDGTHVIRNAESGRKLFALKDHEWTEGVGAGRGGEETHPDNRWQVLPIDACGPS